MVESFVCPRCGNSNPLYLGKKNGITYCRRCISFIGEEAPRKIKEPKLSVLDLSYSLSKEQEEISSKVIENYIHGIDTLVYAVCGSGKTEISYGVIGYAMSMGLRVGFALPRRDVVIELYYRLRSAFPKNSVIAVYGQHTSKLEGDCIILTTHQLYRYPQYFDLLVMDEIDAFPFKGSDVLVALFKHSLKGHCLMMSATPSKEIKEEFKKENHEILELHTRFHKKPIPVPVIAIRPSFFQHFFLIKKLKEYQKRGKPCFVFVPSVELSETLFSILKIFVPHGNYVSSKREGRETIISDFKKQKYAYLITTAVLERGVTIKDVQVIIYHADNSIYDSAALIQIAGRVGRKKDAYKGDAIFLCEKATKAMDEAIREIKRCNRDLQTMLQKD